MLLRNAISSETRRGVILMVVLALLTLFAIVGLSFVLYAQAEADASRIYREDKNLRLPVESADRMWSFALSKLIYDEFDDTSGYYSALRGHSLARSMYGQDNNIGASAAFPGTTAFAPNQLPFSGTGRLQSPNLTTPFANLLEWQAVNYTFFQGDGVAHDPERLYFTPANAVSWRNPFANPAQNPGPITGGINVPYTYPDVNNMFLGAINANGQVLMPSFHRPWLFGSNVPGPGNNPNWENSSRGKYMTLTPRPVEQLTQAQVVNAGLPWPLPLDTLSGAQQNTLHQLITQLQNNNQLFPYPEDQGGHVKNLYWLPGPNDSYWVDLNYPVQVAPDGRKYKPMFAFFITDLDNRINLNAHGNIRGVNGAHVSNQGWVKTEINLSQVLIPGVPTGNPNAPPNARTEWQNLFTGIGNPNAANFVTVRGKYGFDNVPNDPITYATGNYSPPSVTPHQWGQADLDGCNLNFQATGLIQLPGSGGYGPYNAFPLYGVGYDNGQGGPNNNAERVNHPLIFNIFNPYIDVNNAAGPPDNRALADDRAFPASEMKELLNGALKFDPNSPAATGQYAQMAANPMKSYLGLLCPFNFNDPLDIAGSMRRRSLVTTISMDIAQPGMIPWMWQNANGTDSNGAQVNTQIQPGNARPGDDTDQISSRAPWGGQSQFPDPVANRNTNAPPANSEFTPNWRAATVPQAGAALQAIKPFLGRLDLARPLQLFPNQINPAITRFDDTAPMPGDPQGRTIYQVYQAAMVDRQNMARDIYRLLRKLCGVQAVVGVGGNPATPAETDLMPRRWLAQLAVNIVDFIDGDDISTPLNYYPDNEVVAAPTDGVTGSNAPPAAPSNPPLLVQATPAAPAVNETLKYWVFGVEMPRVVLNEVFAEYNYQTGVTTTPPAMPVHVWAELFCPLSQPVAGSNWDQSDNTNVQLVVQPTGTSGAANIAPYRVMIANTQQAPNGGPLLPRPSGLTAPLSPWLNDNILGTCDQIRHYYGTDDTLNDPTLAATGAFTANVGMYWAANGKGGLAQQKGTLAITPQGYVIVGPGSSTAGTGFGDQRGTILANLPQGTVCVPSDGTAAANADGAMTYYVNVNAAATPPQWTMNTGGQAITDNTTGITVLLRRLANPRMPLQNNPGLADFNPYVTVDYMDGIGLQNYNNNTSGQKNVGSYEFSFGKLQPFASDAAAVAADNHLVVPQGQRQPPAALAAAGQTVTTFAQPNNWGQNTTVVNPIVGGAPNPQYPSFDWLVHLDRVPLSPVELLNVCFFHPHELTHRFIQLPPGATMPVAAPLPSQWKYKQTGLGPWLDAGGVARTGPWFDQTTRLYRFLEFVECFDRAYGMPSDGIYGTPTVVNGVTMQAGTTSGVSSIGRRSGRININTVWDQEILQALFDSQTSNYFSIGDVTTIYNNLLNGRTPGYAAVTTGGNPLTAIGQLDRPFISGAAGHMPYTDPNFGSGQNGMGISDSFFRPNSLALNNAAGDPTNQGHPELPRLFENPLAVLGNIPDPTKGHPYLRFEPFNKVYNNLTTRSNVFAVWCTVGYFEVVDDTTRPVRLGAEIGKAAGTNVRHRFFGIVDRTELVVAPTIMTSIRNLTNGVPPDPNPPGPGDILNQPAGTQNPPGTYWFQIDPNSPVMPRDPNTGFPLLTFTAASNPGDPFSCSLTGQTAMRTGMPNIEWTIQEGTLLSVERGTNNEEIVAVTGVYQGANPPAGSGTATAAGINISPPHTPPAVPGSLVTPIWIRANFLRAHSQGFGFTIPGNPGPQPPIDVRDYQHAPVVPVSVNVSAN
jgi:hypothetical protein